MLYSGSYVPELVELPLPAPPVIAPDEASVPMTAMDSLPL